MQIYYRISVINVHSETCRHDIVFTYLVSIVCSPKIVGYYHAYSCDMCGYICHFRVFPKVSNMYTCYSKYCEHMYDVCLRLSSAVLGIPTCNYTFNCLSHSNCAPCVLKQYNCSHNVHACTCVINVREYSN